MAATIEEEVLGNVNQLKNVYAESNLPDIADLRSKLSQIC